MSDRAIGASYANSFLWIVLFTALTAGGMVIAHLVFFDIVHGNPHRTQDDVIAMIVLQAPIVGVVAAIASILVFALPQAFQVALVVASHRVLGSRTGFAVFPALPFTAILTWYCYDYLTPSDFGLGVNFAPDWTPYKHGISIARYAGALEFQTPVTLFSFLYFVVGVRGASRRPFLGAALVLTIAIAVVWGYVAAQRQIELLSSRQ
jgi:hypothetical protein